LIQSEFACVYFFKQFFARLPPLASAARCGLHPAPSRYATGFCMLLYTPCQEKGTESIFAITSTNLDNYSHFLAQIILTIRVTEKL